MNQLPESIKYTYLFAIIILLLFVVFIIFVVSLYNRKQLLFLKEKQLSDTEFKNQILEKELENRKIVEKERERIAHDLHDDLGAGISAIKLQSEFLRKRIKDELAEEDINNLLKTAEDMQYSMREMLWSLNSEKDTIGNVVQYLTHYTEFFLSTTPIQLHFIQEQIVSSTIISAKRRRNLLLCVKEALNNVYKHSQAQNLWMKFIHTSASLTIELIDDGCGIAHNSRQGNGLRNMQFRMKNIDGSFLIKDAKKGTHLAFIAPL